MENCDDLEKRVGTSVIGVIKDVLLEELYIDFVPRWFKKRMKKDVRSVVDEQIAGAVSGLSSALKFGVGIGLYPLSMTLDFGSYETFVRGLSIYLALDGTYQLFSLISLYSEGRRKAATLALDLFTYPFYLMSSQYRLEQAGTK